MDENVYYNFPFEVGDYVICTDMKNKSSYLRIEVIKEISTHEDLGRLMADAVTLEYKIDNPPYYDINNRTYRDIKYFKHNYKKIMLCN